jgi:hypothetical protein
LVLMNACTTRIGSGAGARSPGSFNVMMTILAFRVYRC